MTRASRPILLLVLGVLIASAHADAVCAQDGGGRSVFAFGAGGRALGLGGAYGALANDASAPLWNAGGLGLVTRSELQFMQTSYYGLGMDEQFASAVLPHWRLGTLSLTFRRFGVDGIEQRDERNVLIASDLSNTEMEFLLGYGKQLAAWSVGGALKIRRHELAGIAASGVGLDLGVMVHPVEWLYPNARTSGRWSVGVSVRNAIEPELRLLQEDVGDPAGLRIGSAYELPVFGTRRLIAAVDLEKTRDHDVRLHAGTELMIHPLLVVRAGVNDGMLSAGTSFQWSGVGVDYSFEQNDVDDVHRVGATFAFGRTVAESRTLAMETREAELQDRFAEEFRKRQEARVADLLTRADTAQRAGDFEAALELLNAATTLAPDHDLATSHLGSCLRTFAEQLEASSDLTNAIVMYSRALAIEPDDAAARVGLERCRVASDRAAERSETLRQRYAEALDAFSINDLPAARAGFEAILEASPRDEEAAAMLRRTKQAIVTEVSRLLDDAERMIEWDQLEASEAAIGRAWNLDPRSRRLIDVTARLSDARAARKTTPPGRPDPKVATVEATSDTKRELTADERREAARLYKRAIDAMSQNATEDAIRYLELVWSIDPSHRSVAEHLKREYLTRGMEFFADGQLERAVELWENVLRIDPDDARAKGYLSRALEQASRTKQILGENR